MHHYGFWQHLAHDLSGKGQFRLILQPMMAILLGIRLGIADAKQGRKPFGWRLFTERHRRWALFKQSLSDAVLPLGFALVLDSILQYLTLGSVRPLGALIVGGLLVWLPFIAARGFTNRFWRRTHRAQLASSKR
jgi:hypothetical protein